MRSKMKAIFVLGVVAALVPQLGMYRGWKLNVSAVVGIIISIFAYAALRDLNASSRKGGIAHSVPVSPQGIRDVSSPSQPKPKDTSSL